MQHEYIVSNVAQVAQGKRRKQLLSVGTSYIRRWNSFWLLWQHRYSLNGNSSLNALQAIGRV